MTPADPWNPEQYDRFKAERQQPFFDLLALVKPAPGLRVLDLGCGTGELTRLLHERLGAAETLGIDSSTAMLARAEPTATCRFAPADIADYAPPRPVDLVFSNAALHWLPDHPALWSRIAQFVAPGGQLAVQVPANFDHPSHTVAAEVAREAPFAAAFGGWAAALNVLRPEAYAELFERAGFPRQHVRLQVYTHRLAARDAVVEWVRGTLLTDYLRRLPADLTEPFLARYRERLLPQLADTRPYFYTFKRLLLWGGR